MRPEIKILHIIGGMAPGGTEVWLMNCLRNMDRSKFCFHFACLYPGPHHFDDEILTLGGKAHYFKSRHRNILAFSHELSALMKEEHFDVVHSHVHHFSGFIMRWSAHAGVPVRIAQSHCASDGRGNSIHRRSYRYLMCGLIFKYATHGLAFSDEQGRALFGRKWGYDPRLSKIYCGLDFEAFKEKGNRAEIRKQVGLPLNSKVIGHVGSFRPQKNHQFLITVASKVINEQDDVYLVMIGKGANMKNVRENVRKLGIESRVLFLGARDDVPRLMLSLFDVFLFPSLFEGLGLVLLEAQAAGLVSIISSVIPTEAIIAPELFRTLDLSDPVEKWKNVIKEVLCAETGERDNTKHLKAVCESPFNINNSLKLLEEIYLTK